MGVGEKVGLHSIRARGEEEDRHCCVHLLVSAIQAQRMRQVIITIHSIEQASPGADNHIYL